jgi:hypothetical protein
MFYTVYKTTNKINGKYYIGKHKTHNLNDGYMGSGKRLKHAIQKYGIENFIKEIICVFDSEQEMNEAEKQLVVLTEGSYNLCEGGNGGFSYINNSGIAKFKGKKHNEESKKRMGHPGNKHCKGRVLSDDHKQIISKSISAALKGRSKSEEHKQKIREALLRRNQNAGMV